MAKITDKERCIKAWERHREKWGLNDYRYSKVDTVNFLQNFVAGWKAAIRA